MPDESDWVHLDKKWICDIMMSIDPEGVQSMVRQAKLKRKEKLEKSQNLLDHMKPEFAQALQNALSFSSNLIAVLTFAYSPKRKSSSLDQRVLKEKEKGARN